MVCSVYNKDGTRMIYLFTGLPGSGKSFDAARNVSSAKYSYVISNSQIQGTTYIENEFLDPAKLISTGKHYQSGEGSLLLIIDECQLLFNSRLWRDTGMDWISFFSQHRKLGYDILLITQNALMLDAQIRELVDTQIAHVRLRGTPLVIRRESSKGLLRDRISLMFLRPSVWHLYDTTNAFLPFGSSLSEESYYDLI